ncbi:class IV adenylate cyclase [Natrarchaeobius halalkaliphilus]|uniref:Class IV adenylate cyclase n=1 Tax=Natrarchaeobius halalkaliphilus TaxID=1679091 RepID=A0A3N6LQ57_9EURY|nr:class IV adenylate cyclase [Natrarchaeobius halalkaliphilus]RQG91693.1 class IV adenylate cyclase [Natrarchaeobius halalkaliphilus]
MYEVEVKVPADLASVRSRLEELEVASDGTVVQTDSYYDAPHRSFPDTDEALRIRTERPTEGTNETRLTYKGPLVDDESKTRKELETTVASRETVAGILTNLGFEAAATVRKERERFVIRLVDVLETPADATPDTTTFDATTSDREYTITLDTVDGVGEFLEVETDVEAETDLEPARDGAYAVLELIGLDPTNQIRTSYLELSLES